MLFNSLTFFIFFALVFGLYCLIDHRKQNILLLLASYIFYGWWNWRFLFLLLLTTTVDFFVAQRIGQTTKRSRRRWFLVSLATNLLVLGFFKYFNFFTDSLIGLFHLFSFDLNSVAFRVLLPVGVSFYTFQEIGYVVDVYRGQQKPATRYVNFALFVSFFPQLIAGPISRARQLLPQIDQPRVLKWSLLISGLKLFYWGLWLKIFVADNLGRIVTPIMLNSHPLGGQVIIAAVAFTWQIYADFAGYTAMARGLATMIGFNLPENFRQPFLATSPQDFWRRWHMTLSNWVQDYIYIPLGGNRRGITWTYINLLITMTVMGLWHGAKWTFVVWGLYWGFFLVGHRLLTRKKSDRINLQLSTGQKLSAIICWPFKVSVTFIIISLGFLLFRSTSINQFFNLIHLSLTNFQWSRPEWILLIRLATMIIIPFIYMLGREFIDRHPLKRPIPWWLMTPFYALTLYLLLFYSSPGPEFIYFNF